MAKRPHPHKIPGANLPKRPHPHRQSWPITITIATVPLLAGIQFSVDGNVVVTGSDGQAHFTRQHDMLSHTLTLVHPILNIGNVRYQFSRWAGQRIPSQAFQRTVSSLPLRQSYTVTASFTAQRQVTPLVVEEDGSPVDPSRVSAITVKSDTGQVVRLSPDVAMWLDSTRPAYRHDALTAQPATYWLQSVMVMGSNVVDAGKQEFQPSQQTTPVFITQFYDLTITGHDALFKSAMGKKAVVTFPNGSQQTLTLNAHHAVSLLDLPRGNYKVLIKAGTAIVTAEQFALSKNKTVNLAVISIGDLVLLGALALVAALTLLGIGRHWRRRLVRRVRRSGSNEQPREEVLT